MSIILNKDIYDPSQGNPLQPVLDVLDLMDKKIKESANVMQKLEAALRKVNTAGGGEAVKELTLQTAALENETKKLIAVEKAKADIEKQLAVQEAKYIELEKGKARELAEIKAKTQELNKQELENAKLKSKTISLYEKESKTLNDLRKQYKELAIQNKENTKEGKALLANIQQLDGKLKRVDASVGQFQRNVGNYTSALDKFGAGLKNLFVGGGIIAGITLAFSKLSAFAQSALDLGSQLSGTKRAFDDLNNPALLDNLRNATGGTISDLELMKSALDADDFKINLNNLPLYFAYARKEVQETGGSVTELVNKLVKGIGKESKKVLTELGISTKDFNEQLKLTPDYVEAVNAIIKKRMIEAGTYIETAADVTARWSARWDNFKASAGGVIDKVLTTISPVLEDIWNWLGKLWDTSTSFLLDFINGWITLYNESLPFRTAIEAIQLTFTSLFETVKLFFNFFIDNLKLTGKLIAYTFNPKNWGAGFGKGLADLLAGQGAEIIGDIKSYGKNIGDAFAKGLEDSKAGKLKLLTKEDFSLSGTTKLGVNEQPGAPTGKPGAPTGMEYDATKDPEIQAYLEKQKIVKEYNDWRAAEDERANLEYQALLDEEVLAKQESDLAKWNSEIEYYELQKELKDKQAEEDKKRFEEQADLLQSVGIEAGNLLGEMIAKGELTIKEFGKFIIASTIDLIAKEILLLQAKILAREIASKSFFGIASAGLLIGITQAFFAGVKAKVMSFATGTDYVNGPGTETSDSIPARLSKGERVVPANINKQLAGISNKDLPGIIHAGLNTIRLEKILSNVNENTSITAQYLSNGVSSWQDAQYRYYRDNKTGLTHRISLYGN